MKGTLARLVELRVRHHRVVPVEHLAARPRRRRRRDGAPAVGAVAAVGRGAAGDAVPRAEPVAGAAATTPIATSGDERRMRTLPVATAGCRVHDPSSRRTNCEPGPGLRGRLFLLRAMRASASSSLRRASSTGASAPVPPRYEASAASSRCARRAGSARRGSAAPGARALPLGEHRATSATRIRRVSSASRARRRAPGASRRARGPAACRATTAGRSRPSATPCSNRASPGRVGQLGAPVRVARAREIRLGVGALACARAAVRPAARRRRQAARGRTAGARGRAARRADGPPRRRCIAPARCARVGRRRASVARLASSISALRSEEVALRPLPARYAACAVASGSAASSICAAIRRSTRWRSAHEPRRRRLAPDGQRGRQCHDSPARHRSARACAACVFPRAEIPASRRSSSSS